MKTITDINKNILKNLFHLLYFEEPYATITKWIELNNKAKNETDNRVKKDIIKRANVLQKSFTSKDYLLYMRFNKEREIRKILSRYLDNYILKDYEIQMLLNYLYYNDYNQYSKNPKYIQGLLDTTISYYQIALTEEEVTLIYDILNEYKAFKEQSNLDKIEELEESVAKHPYKKLFRELDQAKKMVDEPTTSFFERVYWRNRMQSLHDSIDYSSKTYELYERMVGELKIRKIYQKLLDGEAISKKEERRANKYLQVKNGITLENADIDNDYQYAFTMNPNELKLLKRYLHN